jgi:hypothetical protein
VQELEAQRILDRVRIHAKAQSTKGRWAMPDRDDAVRRSLSRPLLTTTNVVAKEVTAEQRKGVQAAAGMTANAVLAPSSNSATAQNAATPGVPASPMRPSTTKGSARSTSKSGVRPRPASAATDRVAPQVSAARHINKLEKEVDHLRETIGVLLESQSGISPGARRSAKPSAHSFNRVTREHALQMNHIEEVVEERKAAEERVLELERERRQIGATAARIDAKLELTRAVATEAEAEVSSHSRRPSLGGPDGSVGFEAVQWAADGRQAVLSDSKAAETPSRPPIDQVLQSVRPTSAGGRMQNTLTSAQEFHFASSPAGKESIMKRRADEDKRRREAEEEAILRYKFTAKSVPDSTKIPLFGMIMSRMETRRKLKHEARFGEMKSIMKPFALLMEHEAELKARIAAGRARMELSLQKELTEARKFRALPIPETIQNPDSEYQEQIKREQDRPERVSAAARALAATASLPPRMAIAEEADKRRKAEREAKLKAEDLAEKREAKFHANNMPDFSEMHQQFTESMRETRKSFAATTLLPFGFDSEERKAAEAARKAALKRANELATSTSLELRARSQSAHGARSSDLNRTTGSAFPLGGTMESTARRRNSTAARTPIVAAPPPAAMTRAVQLRMLDVQKRLRERQEQERKLAIEEEQRRAKVKEATRAIAPLVQQLEAERNPIPLAWQQGSVATAATVAKEQFERTARQNAEDQRRRIEAAAESRPMLFMRSSMDVRKEEARRSALMDAAKTVGAPVSRRWEEVVASGVEGMELFDEEDRQFLTAGSTSRWRPQSAPTT